MTFTFLQLACCTHKPAEGINHKKIFSTVKHAKGPGLSNNRFRLWLAPLSQSNLIRYAQTADQLREQVSYIVKKMIATLPQLFNYLPRNHIASVKCLTNSHLNTPMAVIFHPTKMTNLFFSRLILMG